MPQTIRAHFDGRVFVPDEPVDVPRDAAVELTVAMTQKAIAGHDDSTSAGSGAAANDQPIIAEPDPARRAFLNSLGPITRRALGIAKLPENKSYRELLDEALAERYLR